MENSESSPRKAHPQRIAGEPLGGSAAVGPSSLSLNRAKIKSHVGLKMPFMRCQTMKGARYVILAMSIGTMLSSCAWQPESNDRSHLLSKIADTEAGYSARCQSSGAALGSRAYKECRALLGDKMSIEKDVLPDRGYARTQDRN
jgi:hypothetical protein